MTPEQKEAFRREVLEEAASIFDRNADAIEGLSGEMIQREYAAAIRALAASQPAPAADAPLDAERAEIERLTKERDAAIEANYRQAHCIQQCSAHLGVDYSGTLEGLPLAVKAVVSALKEAQKPAAEPFDVLNTVDPDFSDSFAAHCEGYGMGPAADTVMANTADMSDHGKLWDRWKEQALDAPAADTGQAVGFCAPETIEKLLSGKAVGAASISCVRGNVYTVPLYAHPAPFDAERVREAWAYRVHDCHIARSPVKARAKFPEATEHLYPASRHADAIEMARLLGGTCTPLYPPEDAR